MPAVQPKAHILITGASGFIGIHCVAAALKTGFKVTGTVRSTEKGEYIKNKFPGQPFDYVIVGDLLDPHAFDGIVKKGKFAGILHTASPADFTIQDPKKFIDPAVNGTVGILKSADAAGDAVQRIVVTSSVTAVINASTKPPKTFTDEDWNTESAKIVEEKGTEADLASKYYASKTLAEQAAWKYVKESSPSFDLVTILPSYTFGPMLHQVPTPKQIGSSIGLIYRPLKNDPKAEDLPGQSGPFVDVRDVAEAHIQALLQEKASGKRYITSAGPWCFQNILDIVSKVDPGLNLPKGDDKAAEAAISPDNLLVFDGSKATRELGIKYTSLEQSIKDMYLSIREYEDTVWRT